jgi:hypothetical protein
MGAIERTIKTNGDVVQPAVDRVKAQARVIAVHFREHPDELAVSLAPFVMLAAATRRHNLSVIEAALIAECAIWGGFLAFDAYRNWKTKPAGAPPRLRKVTLCRTHCGSSWPA